MTAKRIFISYSHDTDEHKSWVERLASYFSANGIEVFLDQWNLEFGDDLATFMERGITDADRVLLVCTDAYNQKANNGLGGVGYEKTIATAEMLASAESRRKFIPIVRNVLGQPKVPTYLGAKLYADMSDGCDEDVVREGLLQAINGSMPTRLSGNEAVQIPSDPPRDVVEANDTADTYSAGDSCLIFNERFRMAFPGLRGIQWFDEEAMISERLAILLDQPLRIGTPQSYSSLACWWRGSSNMPIDNFAHIEQRHFLLDIEELNIDRIAAVNLGAHYQCFIYIQAASDGPTGLYELPKEGFEESLGFKGYVDEEYGLVDGTLPISRAEYDDGAAIIDGRPVDVRGRVELRVRHLSPYNLIVAPHCSPINNMKFDSVFESQMNGILNGQSSLEELCEEIRRLPRRPQI
ncbi:toll/interleukin-1 receptor domain-containing protein [Yoonia sp.]|nr:toll/interleukin-1 receptor domain-containing protein [Yoonia sp.]